MKFRFRGIENETWQTDETKTGFVLYLIYSKIWKLTHQTNSQQFTQPSQIFKQSKITSKLKKKSSFFASLEIWCVWVCEGAYCEFKTVFVYSRKIVVNGNRAQIKLNPIKIIRAIYGVINSTFAATQIFFKSNWCSIKFYCAMIWMRLDFFWCCFHRNRKLKLNS